MALMKLYQEHQVLVQMIGKTQDTSLKLNHEIFDKYLISKIRYFEKKNKHPNNNLLKDFLFAYNELIPPSEISLLKYSFDNIRLQIKKRLWGYLKDVSLFCELNFKSEFKQIVRHHIVNNNLVKTIDYIESELKLNEKQLNELTNLRARINEVESNSRLGVISASEESIQYNKLRIAILSVADEFISMV